MAFNHVGDCCCPVGDCMCNWDQESYDRRQKVRKHIDSLMPKDIYIYKQYHDKEMEEEMIECTRSKYRHGENLFFVGQVDPDLEYHQAIGMLFAFHGWLFSEQLISSNIEGAEYMKMMLDALREYFPYQDLKKDITPLFTTESCRV